MADGELEEHLRPALHAHLRRPAGQRLVLDPGEQFAVVEGAVDQHRHALVPGQRQYGFCRRRRINGVMNLNKVERFTAQDPFHLVQAAIQVVGDAHIFGLALLFQLAGIGQLGLPVAQVVHLQQFHLIGAQRLQRFGPLPLGLGTAVGGDLGGQEALVPPAALFQQRAQHLVRAAVVGRGIEHGGAAIEEDRHHFLEALVLLRADLGHEAAGGAGADHGYLFAAGRDGAAAQAFAGG